MTKVVLLESHPLMRLGLHQILNSLLGDWEVTAYDSRNLARETRPDGHIDLMVFGIADNLDHAWDSLTAAHAWLEPERVLLVADPNLQWETPPQWIKGLYGCIPKTSPVEVLEAAIRLGMAGGQCFPVLATSDEAAGQSAAPHTQTPPVLHNRRSTDRPNAAAAVPSTSALSINRASPVSSTCMDGAQTLNLTPRQFEVLKLLARGYPIKTVSRTLNISTATAKAHASTLYQRLHVNSKGEAVYAARQRGVLLD